MKNPCRECDHHESGLSKDCERCTECGARVAYVRGMGGMYSSMPDKLTDMRRHQGATHFDTARHAAEPSVVHDSGKENNDMAIETAAQTKVCSRSQCEHAGAPQPLDNFDTNRKSKDGKAYHCKDCRRSYQSSLRSRRSKKKVSTSSDGQSQMENAAPSNKDRIPEKQCKKCGHTKPLDEFPSKKSCKDGHEGTCKVCRLEREKQLRIIHRSDQSKAGQNAKTSPYVFERLVKMLSGRKRFDRHQLEAIRDMCGTVYAQIDDYLRLHAIFNGGGPSEGSNDA